MKKAQKFIPLLALFVLTGCNDSTTSTKSNSENNSVQSQTQNSTNTNTDKKTDTTNNTTSTNSHVVPVDKIDKEAIISDLSEGFTAETLITSGTESMGYDDNYYSFATTNDAYSYTKYASADTGYAKKDSVSSKGLYQPYYNGGTTYLTQVELGLDNKLHYYYLVDSSSSYVTWDNAGYHNPFEDLYGGDFKQNAEDPYQLDLIMGDSKKEKNGLYTNFANCFTGVMGYTLSSFSLLTDGVQAYGYKMTFDNYTTSSYGVATTFASGTFGEDRDDEVVELLSPVEGEKDTDFENKITTLQGGNYKADITLPNRKYKVEVYGNNAISYDLYHTDGTKYGSYGYYQVNKSQVQGITKINGNYYVDSNPISGYMSSMLPSFSISSVLFEKDDSSTGTKAIYKLKEEIASSISMDSVFYNLLGGSVLGTLTITFEDNKVTFTNKISELDEEEYVYYDFGKVTDFTSSINTTCDSLKWSDLFSNQPEEYAQLTSKFITEEYLDEFPTIGGTSSYITLYSNNKRGLVQTVVAIEDYADGQSKIEAYVQKAEAAGFTVTKKTSSTLNYTVSKEVTKNGVTKTITADVLLSASYFTTPTVVFTFSSK